MCDTLFSVLHNGGYTDKLHKPSSHRQIYPCSLPPWLPRGVVDKMLQIFKDMLLAVLNDAVALGESSRRSIDSHDSQGGASDTSSEAGNNHWDSLVVHSAEAEDDSVYQ